MNEYKLDPVIADETEKEFSRTLNNKELIRSIIIHSQDKKDYFEELVFTSKYVMGLFRAAAKQEFTNRNVIEKELSENISKVRILLKEIMGNEGGETESVFFSSDDEGFVRLSGLLSDLELIKLYLNDIRRGS